ncbi:helix-turn-helix domain-containing protein [Salinisphaera sp. LB1]|uniref:helix-turn-helix domain-containing protein n=1 Tax=Salinisphaera sp. LB1 TaxID=2183911 RepID=UPI000D7064C4|nr:helix-turn-helix domain-containing protein [Salinisphaera sp. LB1]
MAEGHAIAIVPTHAELTTQQSVHMLNVSRPHLIRLLQAGEIQHTKTGSHRHIHYEDIFTYQQEQRPKAESCWRNSPSRLRTTIWTTDAVHRPAQRLRFRSRPSFADS